MKLRILLSILFCCFAAVSQAQPASVRGQVVDTLNQNMLPYSTVTLVRARDSIMADFTRTGQDGKFELRTDSIGKYILLISFPGFADYIDAIHVPAGGLDIGKVPLISKSHLLQEVVVKQQIAAIKIKGDTTEYMADSFAVRDGASVEELLKKLPGIQVDKNGQIKTQGETVQKILVDGEEFFSDDPAVVTKNLDARAVEKVQVFDKKSDQAEFTGIDDGEKMKTINLQLKEDRKKGYFGKLSAGGGTDQFFENQAMINAFKGRRKIAAFGIMSNTGKVGLGWEDRDKFGGGNNSYVDEESGNMYSYYDGDDGGGWNGSYGGEGLPKVWTGGLHYSDKWSEDRQHLSGNYRFSRQNTETTGGTFTKYNLPDSAYYTDQKRESFSTGDRHRVDGMYEWKYDSSSSIKLSANAGYADTRSNSRYASESKGQSGAMLNNSDRRNNTDGTTRNVNANLIWRKKFAKKGRSMSLDLNENFRSNESNGYLNSVNNFYSNGSIVSTTTIDQRKDQNSEQMQLNGRISYTEPLSKEIFLEVNYALAVNNNTSRNFSYNKDSGDDYMALDSLFSSHYDYNVLTNTGGSNLHFVYKKLNFSFGGSVSNARFRQKDLLFDTAYDRNYTNLFSRANLNWKIGKQTSFSLSYNGNTRQPSLEQIQPIRQNTDPLNISIGNPDLKQEFNHNFNVRYNDYKVLSGIYTYVGVGVNFVNNDISRTETVNEFGARTSRYININGNYSGWAYGGYGFKIKKLNLHTSVRGNINTSHVNNFVNGIANTSNNNTYTLGLNINYDKEQKWNISYNPSVSFTDNHSTINTTNTNFWTMQNELSASVQLPYKFEIGSDIDWNVRQKTVVFDNNNNVFLWNAYVSRKFLKNDKLVVRLYVNDILNQNLGFRRYGEDNYVAQNTYNTIRRYGLLSLTWSFSKNPAQPNPQD